MSYQSNNLNLEILEESDPADLTTVSDNFDKIDAAIGDIATFETSPTTAAHSVGEYLLYEGRLYKVTAAISAGANLTLGTNVSAANIGDDIKTLQDSVSDANLVEQKAGTSITLAVHTCAVAISTSTAYAFVGFPFRTKNINYSAVAYGNPATTGNTMGIEAVSGILPVSSYSKKEIGVRLAIEKSNTFTEGKAYFTFGTVVITFA